ncbi:hypothetical protein COOONC_22165 [Cooperia oncophora]
MTGIYDAYMKRNLTPEIGFDLSPIMMIQLSGELFDLNKYLNKTPDPQEYPEAGRCSGFVKLAPGNEDMFFAHVAMSSLSWMIRVLKLYKFAFGKSVTMSRISCTLNDASDQVLRSCTLFAQCFLKQFILQMKERKSARQYVSFSGYPAQLASADDYTLTSAGLGSIETTIAIFNKSLYSDKYIKQRVTRCNCWLRSTISNYLTK